MCHSSVTEYTVLIYINKNESPKCMNPHNFRTTASNWIINFCCVRYGQDKICIKEIFTSTGFFWNIFQVEVAGGSQYIIKFKNNGSSRYSVKASQTNKHRFALKRQYKIKTGQI